MQGSYAGKEPPDAEVTQTASDAQAQDAPRADIADAAMPDAVSRPPEPLINQRLRALRIRSGLSAPEVARRLAKSHTTYKSWEDRPRERLIPMEMARDLAKVLSGLGQPPIAEAEVIALAGGAQEMVMWPQPNARMASEAPVPPGPDEMPRDVPVMGTAAGANGDGAFIVNFVGGPIDYVRRPPGIRAARNVFAIYVENDSMMPRFEPGEHVYCDPSRPPGVGAYVVVVLDGPEHGDPPRAYLKRLVKRTATELVVEQFNPPKEIRFPVDRVKQLVRVLDWRDLTGV